LRLPRRHGVGAIPQPRYALRAAPPLDLRLPHGFNGLSHVSSIHAAGGCVAAKTLARGTCWGAIVDAGRRPAATCRWDRWTAPPGCLERRTHAPFDVVPNAALPPPFGEHPRGQQTHTAGHAGAFTAHAYTTPPARLDSGIPRLAGRCAPGSTRTRSTCLRADLLKHLRSYSSRFALHRLNRLLVCRALRRRIAWRT